MRAVLQRVTEAYVTVDQQTVGKIGAGLVVLLGVETGDDETDARYIAQKTAGLRIFEDEAEKMNRSVQQAGGSVLVISQFTLLGDARKGRRPGFTRAEAPERADELYHLVCKLLEEEGLSVEKGRFQTHMQVHLVNDGPTTILLDSKKMF